MERSCMNCHYGVGTVVDVNSPCNRQGGCYFNERMPDWKPMTNADAIRRKTDDELAGMLLAWQQKKVAYKTIKEWLKKDFNWNK